MDLALEECSVDAQLELINQLLESLKEQNVEMDNQWNASPMEQPSIANVFPTIPPLEPLDSFVQMPITIPPMDSYVQMVNPTAIPPMDTYVSNGHSHHKRPRSHSRSNYAHKSKHSYEHSHSHHRRSYSPSPSPTRNTELFVWNIAHSLEENTLREAFEQFGTIERFHMTSRSHGKIIKRFAFIRFATESQCRAALSLDNKDFNGRNLGVRLSDGKKT